TEDADIQIYPNPASSHLSIESPNEEITHVSMVDMLGQEVYNAEVANAHQHEIRVSGLNTGMYFIRIATSKGMVTYKAQVTR
ncbi:MAG: T9SS type A sorting domain-containing protein, partial [Bacteroidales bacterium]